MMSGHVFNAFEEKRYRIGSDRRVFYLWQDEEALELFNSVGFTVYDFSKSVSKTGSGEIWMSYVLDKTG